eukprot:scaffold3421_cov181-Amphora_coffeaeformis.AAC.2
MCGEKLVTDDDGALPSVNLSPFSCRQRKREGKKHHPHHRRIIDSEEGCDDEDTTKELYLPLPKIP